MIISDKKHSELYKSISDPIMELRLDNQEGLTIESIDGKLFELELKIHKNIIKALNLQKVTPQLEMKTINIQPKETNGDLLG